MEIPNRLIPAVVVALVGIASAFAPSTSRVRKDKVAVILYGGLMQSPVVIAHSDTANMVDIALLRIRGTAVDPNQLATRPCLGLALFTAEEWKVAQERGARAGETLARMARTGAWLYPAMGTDSAVVLEMGSQRQQSQVAGVAWIALGAFHLRSSSIPVTVSPDTPPRCDIGP